jgi:hypothetical protein
MMKSFTDNNKGNIFTGQGYKSNVKGDEDHSPMITPHKKNEHESHTSSAYGKLTPVYDPKSGMSA